MVVVQAIPVEPAVVFVQPVPAAGGSETKTVHGFLVEAGMIYPNALSLKCAEIKAFMSRLLSG